MFGSMSEVKLNELRKMIVGLDTEDLQRLSIFVNDPDAFSQEISGLLPTSIKLMLEKGDISYSVLMPVVESALKDSVKQNPKVLADVLFPIMMPAIRKAVADDLSKMIESLNSTLENSFSPKRLGWRFKSMFSSSSYAEIVLSNAYIFRVKQVFLIHKQSGLLLGEVSDNRSSVTKDSDMVSSMLSAIKDFVQDSFDTKQQNELDTIKVGQFNIWIEQGPHAILAAIVEGNAPAEYRTILKETIEIIHLKQSYELEHFEGDIEVFKKSDAYLESCVISEQKEKKKKRPIIIMLLFAILVGGLVFLLYNSFDSKLRINKLENALRIESGIIITNNDNNNGKIVFEGLRDPLASNPIKFLAIYDVDTSEVVFSFKPYISLEDELILKRAYFVLELQHLLYYQLITIYFLQRAKLIKNG
jgi:OOP family OmpA-OmpF porin